MYTSIFALVMAVISVIGMAVYGMPAYMAGAMVVAAIAMGMAMDMHMKGRAAIK